jgi:hypothetical protein
MRSGKPAGRRRDEIPKTKTSQTQRVMGRSSNSPPPKSAHKQPNVLATGWEWLQRAIYKIVNAGRGGVESHENGFRVVAEISFHGNLRSSYMRNRAGGYRANSPCRTPARGRPCLRAKLFVWQPSVGPGRGGRWPRHAHRSPCHGLAIALHLSGSPQIFCLQRQLGNFMKACAR